MYDSGHADIYEMCKDDYPPPDRGLRDGRLYVAFKDDPQGYVLALNARIGEDKERDGDGADFA